MTTSASVESQSISSKNDREYVLLIASDSDGSARVLAELGSLTEEQFHVEWVTGLSDGIERLRDEGVRAVVLDLNLLGSQGVERFDQILQAAAGVPILILSDAETEELARKTVQGGAQNYLLKEQADGYRLRWTARSMIDRCAAETVALENETAKATLNSIGEAVLCTDENGNITYLNRFAEKLTGWLRSEALGLPAAEVVRLIDSVSGASVDNAVEAILQGDRSANVEICSIHCTLVRRDGVEFGIEDRVTSIDDANGHGIGTVMTIRDVSTARAASLEISRVAQHDSLTNLPNRILFNDRLVQAISLADRQNKK